MSKNDHILQGGYSVWLVIILIPIAIITIAVISNVVSRNSQKSNIERQIDSLQISAPLQSKDCGTGDGLDSGAECRYEFKDKTGSSVGAALRSAGYTSKYSPNEYFGGNPSLVIQLIIDNGTTTLDATQGN